MKPRHLVALVLALTLLPACQDMLNKLNMQNIQNMLTPKAKPEMVAMIKNKAAGIGFSSTEKLGKSNKSRMTIKAGQWVTTLTTSKDASGNVTLTTTRVISVKGSSVVMETESYSALDEGKRQLAQITFANYPVKGDLSYSQADYDEGIQNITIEKIVTRSGDDPPQEMPKEALAMSQQMGKNIAGATVRSGDMTADACETEYIRSARCYAFDFTVSVMGITQSGRSVVHSKIPVTGLVRMESDGMIEETISFGTSGAKSMF